MKLNIAILTFLAMFGATSSIAFGVCAFFFEGIGRTDVAICMLITSFACVVVMCASTEAIDRIA